MPSDGQPDRPPGTDRVGHPDGATPARNPGARRILPLRLPAWLGQLIAPPVCLLCGGEGQQAGEPWGLDLCRHCEAACPRAGPEPPPLETAFCLFRYEDPVDQLILRLKFQQDIAAARVLGMLLARALRESGRELPECVVPMPLHASRLRERGFCQTGLIARHAAARLRTAGGRSLPVRPGLLLRVRGGAPQSTLAASQRTGNLAGAFAAPPLRHPPRHVALLDDVLTTGSTARAAMAALRAAGIGRVELWCCARTPRPEGPPEAPGPSGKIARSECAAAGPPAIGPGIHWRPPTTSSRLPPPRAGARTWR